MNTTLASSSRRPAGPPLAARAKRWLYLIHRWAGIVLCLFFAMWFISGVVMMYVGYPKLTPQERLAHLPPLDRAAIAVTPAQALAAAGASFDDVAKLTVYIPDWNPENMPLFAEGITRAATRLGIEPPAAPLTGIGVTALAAPDLLVEVEATAVVDD